MNIQSIRTKLNNLKAERDLITSQLSDKQEKVKELEEKSQDIEDAREVLQATAKLTQEQLEYHISDIVSLALFTVFDDPIDFGVEFLPKRNKTEAEFYFIEGGDKINPMDASGGGPIDVAAFALRVSMWSLQVQKTRNVLILDEPFRYLSRDMHGRASKMLKDISKRLKLQIIMVSHSPELIDAADRVFEVEKIKGVSVVK